MIAFNETWGDADDAAVRHEGWFMSNVYGTSVAPDGSLLLERDDEAAVFADDYQAMLFVMARAQSGSAIHQKALRMNYSPEGAH